MSSYKIHVDYEIDPAQKYLAEITVLLPKSPESQNNTLDTAYVNTNILLQCDALSSRWGRNVGDGYLSATRPTRLIADSVAELGTMVAKELFEIQQIVHMVYVGRVDRTVALPPNQILEINPAILLDDRKYKAVEPDEPNFTVIELNNWRNRIIEGDKIRVWISEENLFVSGFVRAIDRSSPLWGLEFLSEDGSDEDWAVSPQDLFPYFMDEADILST